MVVAFLFFGGFVLIGVHYCRRCCVRIRAAGSLYRESFDAVVSESDLQETYWSAWRRVASQLSGAMCS